jgi:hypothetical protein
MATPVAILRLSLLMALLLGVTWWLVHISRRKWMKSLVIVIAIIAACPLLLLVAESIYEFHMVSRGRGLTARLEEYRAFHGEYPISLSRIGIDEAKEGIFYQRDYESPLVFYLWFNTGFGTVSQYDSETRTWHGPR